MPLHNGVGNRDLTMVRPDVVTSLMDAANSGMKAAAAGSTGDEVFAAYLTLARNAVEIARTTRRDNQDIREALMSMLVLLDTPGQVH